MRTPQSTKYHKETNLLKQEGQVALNRSTELV